MSVKTGRKEALSKWRSLTHYEQVNVFMQFQFDCWKTGHYGRTWGFQLFSTSSSMIEKAMYEQGLVSEDGL